MKAINASMNEAIAVLNKIAPAQTLLHLISTSKSARFIFTPPSAIALLMQAY